jgi:hypothetical protein
MRRDQKSVSGELGVVLLAIFAAFLVSLLHFCGSVQ